MKVQVGHHAVSVECFPAGGPDDGRCGDYLSSRLRIRVDNDLPATIQAETLIHELIHAMYDAHGWENAMTEEQVCEALGRGLAQLFQANPEIYAVIDKALTKGKPVV
jgi:hypothetical protein